MNPPQEAVPRRVLLVDDDLPSLESAGRALRAAGYEVACAKDAGSALRELAQPRWIDAVVADVVLPDLSGLDLARRARQLRPSAALLLTSGYGFAGLGELPEGAAFLPKPFSAEQLLASLRGLLAAAGPPV